LSAVDETTYDVIIFIHNMNLRNVVRDCLKEISGFQILNSESDEQSLEYFQTYPKAWFIHDSSQDPQVLAKTLGKAQGQSPLATRPIYLILADVSKEILSIALEFNVLKVRSSDINANSIKQDVSAITTKLQTLKLVTEVMPDVLKYRAEARWDGAIATLKVAQLSDPGNDQILLELADTQFLAGDANNAMATAESVLSRSGANLRAMHLKARILMRQKKFQEASEILADAEQNSIFNSARLLDMGECLLNLEKYKDAKDRFQQVLKIDPDNAAAKSGEAKAVILQGDIDCALDMIRSFTSDEQIAATLNSAAIISARHGRNEPAMIMYKQCITLLSKNEPLSARVWFNFGLAYMRQNNPGKALACFESAVMLDPQFIDAAHNYHVVTRRLAREGKGHVANINVKQPLRPGETLIDVDFYGDTNDKS
jgi:tetratricopeptide (TPR) repeat protein